jgi:hypothetical protein
MSGPGVRRNVHSKYPATIYDIAPTILALLGAPWSGMDGTPLYDAFTNPDPQGAAAQAALGRVREPFVQGLMLQSSRDGR